MLNGKKIIVVMPAYNAEKTLQKTVDEIPYGIVDEILLIDDKSSDKTVEVARGISNVSVFIHDQNLGYGGNQKTCYRLALERGADVVVMLHPDYQYDPRLILGMAAPICFGVYDVMFGSRILGGKAVEYGMPRIKYVLNRLTTFIWNILYKQKLSEFHSGYRAFSRKVLETVPFQKNSNDFVFDHEMLAQIFYFDFPIGEISCPARYFAEASSIGFKKGSIYLIASFRTVWKFLSAKSGKKNELFEPAPQAASVL